MPGVGALSYDIDNRLAWDWATSKSYAYDAENRRVWKSPGNELYFYGVDGRRVGTYQVTAGGQYWLNIQPTEVNLYFAGRLIRSQDKWVATDRLGSVVKRETERLRYFPWGEEQVTSTQNRDKFGTYYRDSTGLDYAMNRYYSSQHGRFLTPDPYRASASPQGWNRYAYVENDPANFTDPAGRTRCIADWGMVWEGCYEVGDPTRMDYGNTRLGGGGGGPSDQSEGSRGGGSRDDEEGYRSECDRADPTNERVLSFIGAHKEDAQTLGAEANVSHEFILAVAAEETLWGTAGIVLSTNNFFGLHVAGKDDTEHFAGQTGVYETSGKPPAYVATFGKESGFLDSGMGFVGIEKKYVSGVTDARQFGDILHEHGYGVGNPGYVKELTGVIKGIAARRDCP